MGFGVDHDPPEEEPADEHGPVHQLVHPIIMHRQVVGTRRLPEVQEREKRCHREYGVGDFAVNPPGGRLPNDPAYHILPQPGRHPPQDGS